MEGKTIVKVLEFGNGYSLLKFDDGEMALVKVAAMDDFAEELAEFLSDGEDKAEPEKTEKKEEPADANPAEETVDDDPYTWEDLEAMDHDDLKELCEDNDLDTDPEDFDEDEDEEMDKFRRAIAEEIDVEAPEAKKEKKEKKEKKKETEEVKDDNYTWEDLEAMDFEELEELCDEQELDTDPNDYDEDDDEDKLRRDVAKELEIDAPKPKKKKKK